MKNAFLLNYSYEPNQISKEKFYNSKILHYYRKLLKSKVNGNEFDLLPPSKEEAFEEIENINLNKENNFSSYGSLGQNNLNNNDDNINIDYKDSIQEGMSSVKDFFGKAYEGTKNAINKMDLGNKLNSAKNVIYDAGKSILENKQINSFINFFWKGKEENENKENNGTENEKGKNNDIDDN